MNIPAPCAECFLEGRKDNPSANPPIVFYKGRVKDDGYVRVKCTKGHDSIILYDERKYDLLFISACHALISGYEREAVSSFAASLERVFEFFIFVASRHCKISPGVVENTWKLMAKQSERQLGSFLAFYELLTNAVYPLDNKMVEFRNKVIHQGYIPDENEAEIFGEYVFNQKLTLIKILQDKCSVAFDDEIKAEMDKMKSSAPKGVPQLGFKATLVNVDLATHKAVEITKFSDYIFGIKDNLKKQKRG